jgi:nucleotide-binding universal stress UspA family protein
MIKSILLSIDGSIYTEPAIRNAIYLARAFGAKIRVLSVVDVRTFEWAMSVGADAFVPVIPSAVYLEETKRLQQQKAAATLQKSEELLREANLPYTLSQESGSPTEVISEHIRTADLLMMGARGEFAVWKSKDIGETLDYISRNVYKPIFIVSKDFKPMTKILAAYDGSDTANKALSLAGYFASKLTLAVTVLAVSSRKEEAKRVLKEAEEYLSNYDIKCKKAHFPGSPEAKICGYAHDHQFDLIVMGAYGHSRIREAILGSTTQTVMRMAKIPVLLAK